MSHETPYGSPDKTDVLRVICELKSHMLQENQEERKVYRLTDLNLHDYINRSKDRKDSITLLKAYMCRVINTELDYDGDYIMQLKFMLHTKINKIDSLKGAYQYTVVSYILYLLYDMDVDYENGVYNLMEDVIPALPEHPQGHSERFDELIYYLFFR